MKRITTGAASIGAVLALAALPNISPAQVAGGEKGCSTKAQRAHGSFSAKLRPKWDGHKPRHWRRIFERDRGIRAYDAIWPITVTARRNGKPISGKIYYQFLSFGRIVACRTVKKPYHPRFTGTFHDRIEFPKRAIGLPLTFRVVLRTKYGLKNLDYKVTVQKP